jgi:hypothetical protein
MKHGDNGPTLVPTPHPLVITGGAFFPTLSQGLGSWATSLLFTVNTAATV